MSKPHEDIVDMRWCEFYLIRTQSILEEIIEEGTPPQEIRDMMHDVIKLKEKFTHYADLLENFNVTGQPRQ